jgi:hypothetical protein
MHRPVTIKGVHVPSLVDQAEKTDLHHGLPRSARLLPIKIEDLSRLPRGARVVLLDDALPDRT